MFFGLCCCLWNGERLALHILKGINIAWPAGDCPLAKAMDRTERDGDAMLVEPFGDFAVSPMLAAQGEDGFAMWLKFAARSALRLGFGCFLQIHIWKASIILSDVRANFARTRATRREPKAVLREDV